MAGEQHPVRLLVRVKAEATFEITDTVAVEDAALAEIDATQFGVEEGCTVEDVRAKERAAVHADPSAAILWLVDPGKLLPELPGVSLDGTEHEVEMLGEQAPPMPITVPDFGALFTLCRCRSQSCSDCSGYQLTPRTAAVLWAVAQNLGDHGYDDVATHGDEQMLGEGDWLLFDRYPRITHTQDAVWRRQAARAFDDLAADLEAGQWPVPTCAGEEMALHLILEDAPAAARDEQAWLDQHFGRLPDHPDDYDWGMASEVFLQDHNVLELLNPEQDGIEDPEAEINQQLGIGDYRPSAWFKPFNNVHPRDGRRPFRR